MTASFRVYHLVMATVKHTEATNPYKYVTRINGQQSGFRKTWVLKNNAQPTGLFGFYWTMSFIWFFVFFI